MIDKKESVEDYLEKILMLKEKNEIVRAVDISNFMSFSKASVSIALKKLISYGYVMVDKDSGNVSLTDKGLERAKNTYSRHLILTDLFENLGVSKENAVHDACKIEHDLSEETFDALTELNNSLKK